MHPKQWSARGRKIDKHFVLMLKLFFFFIEFQIKSIHEKNLSLRVNSDLSIVIAIKFVKCAVFVS